MIFLIYREEFESQIDMVQRWATAHQSDITLPQPLQDFYLLSQ